MSDSPPPAATTNALTSSPPSAPALPLSAFPTSSAFTAPRQSVPYTNVPLDQPQLLRWLQDSTDWIEELSKKQLFKGLGIQILSETELPGKVTSLLSLAYETRDMHIAQLFALERKHRRDAMALEMQKLTLLDARAKISVDFTELDDVKGVLTSRGFGEEVRRFTDDRDAPNGCTTLPSDIAFVYKPLELQPPARSCADQALNHDQTSVNRLVPAL